MKPRPNHAEYIRIQREMGPERRLQKAFELSAFARRLLREGLEISHGHLTAAERQAIYLRQIEHARERVNLAGHERRAGVRKCTHSKVLGWERAYSGHLTGHTADTYIEVGRNGGTVAVAWEEVVTTTVSREYAQRRETLEWAHKELGLTFAQLGDALRVSERTLRRWRNADVRPNTPPAGLDDLGALKYLLEQAFAEPDARAAWLTEPNQHLRGRTPLALLRRGKIDEVVDLLAAYEAGVFF